MTNRCLEHVPATSLVDEDEMTSRRSELQLAKVAGKEGLARTPFIRYLSRKQCRPRMREDIIDAFWGNRLNEVV